MVFSEKYAMLWYSRFTCFSNFSNNSQPGLFDAKSDNIKSSYTKSVCTKRNSTKYTVTGNASITGICIMIAGLTGPSIGSVYARNTFTRDVWIKIADNCTGSAKINNVYIKNTFTGRACARRA